jgi:hypothetical protein
MCGRRESRLTRYGLRIEFGTSHIFGSRGIIDRSLPRPILHFYVTDGS